MTTLKRLSPVDDRTDLFIRLALAAVVVLADLSLGAGDTGALLFFYFLIDSREPAKRRHALLVGSGYALAVLGSTLLPFNSVVAIAVLAGALNTALGLGTYKRSPNKQGTLVFVAANVILAAVGLGLGLSAVQMSLGALAFLFLFVAASWWGFTKLHEKRDSQPPSTVA